MAKILIAEDDKSMREFLVLALERAGHKVTACEDGIAAMETLSTQKDFDLLLADIVMPGMDGIELSQKASYLYPSLKIMFITGFAAVATNSARQDTNQDAPKILSKPFHLKELVGQIETLLAA